MSEEPLESDYCGTVAILDLAIYLLLLCGQMLLAPIGDRYLMLLRTSKTKE
jgi:hypothetical protein